MITSKFDEAIQAILEDLSNQGKGGMTQTGGKITPQQTSAPAQTNTSPSTPGNIKTGVSVTAPPNKFVGNKPAINQNLTPLLDQDGKTPIIDPTTNQPMVFDRDLAQKNPQQFLKDFQPKIQGFNPEQQKYLMSTIFPTQQ